MRDPFDGQFEPLAVELSQKKPDATPAEITSFSIAISLKRIADMLDGTTMGVCCTETIFNPHAVRQA